jgi:hypothetical protein
VVEPNILTALTVTEDLADGKAEGDESDDDEEEGEVEGGEDDQVGLVVLAHDTGADVPVSLSEDKNGTEAVIAVTCLQHVKWAGTNYLLQPQPLPYLCWFCCLDQMDDYWKKGWTRTTCREVLAEYI